MKIVLGLAEMSVPFFCASYMIFPFPYSKTDGLLEWNEKVLENWGWNIPKKWGVLEFERAFIPKLAQI